TNEPILAENRVRRQCILSRRLRGSRDGRSCRRLHELDDVEPVYKRLGNLRIGPQQLFARRLPPRLKFSQIRGKHRSDPRVVLGFDQIDGDGCRRPGVAYTIVWAHSTFSSLLRSWRRARNHMFLTLSSVRPICCATASKLKPWACLRTITS